MRRMGNDFFFVFLESLGEKGGGGAVRISMPW